MKKNLLVACCLLLVAFSSQAQKYAIIDTRYILDKMPDYTLAQKQLDAIDKRQPQKGPKGGGTPPMPPPAG